MRIYPVGSFFDFNDPLAADDTAETGVTALPVLVSLFTASKYGVIHCRSVNGLPAVEDTTSVVHGG